MTENLSTNDAALAVQEKRKHYIGSSDAGAVCGLSPWRSNVDVWLEKTGRKEPDDISGKKAIRRGKMLEPVIREIISVEAGIAVTHSNQRYFAEDGTAPLCAEIDFEFLLDGQSCNGEIKTCYSKSDWGEEWTDQIPDYYMAQVLHGQMVKGNKKTLVVAAFGFDDFRYYWVEFDVTLAGWIQEQEQKFWQCVIDDVAPTPTTLEAAYAAFYTDSGEVLDAAAKDVEDVLLWRGLDKQIAGLEDQRDAVELRLCQRLQDKQGLVSAGKLIFTWKAQNHTHLDQKGLKAEAPDLVKKHMVTKKIRVARATGGKLWQQEAELID